MYIVPMTGITPLASINRLNPSADTSATRVETEVNIPFSEVFASVLRSASETGAQAAEDSMNVVLGDVDDLHTIPINSTKALAAVELLVSVRDKALDAYNEIMRMNL